MTKSCGVARLAEAVTPCGQHTTSLEQAWKLARDLGSGSGWWR